MTDTDKSGEAPGSWTVPRFPPPQAAPEPDANGRERDHLLQCIVALKETEQQLASLTAGRERARSQSWAISTRLSEAEDALRKAQAEEPRRLAREFAFAGDNGNHGGNGLTTTEVSPVEAATAAMQQALAEDRRNLDLGNALDQEIYDANARLLRCQVQVHGALANLIVNSDEYRKLIELHREAWQRLRTIKETLRAVQSACNGQLPQRFADEAWRSEPLEIRVGYGVDNAFVHKWAEALSQLLEDPDADLPQV